MALKLYNDTDIQAIADAIRSVNGELTTYKVSEMAAVISTFSYTAPPAGNLRDLFGYTNNKRLSTADGSYRDAAGYTVVEYIPLADYVVDNEIIIRTKYVDFKSTNHSNCSFVAYNASKVYTTHGYPSEGGTQLGDVYVLRAFDNDADYTMTMTITANDPAIFSAGWSFLRIVGYGDGANLDIRINEEF